MSQLLSLLAVLLVLGCPLMMVWMMLGMHGGHDMHGSHGHSPADVPPDERIAVLEREVDRLKAQRGVDLHKDDFRKWEADR